MVPLGRSKPSASTAQVAQTARCQCKSGGPTRRPGSDLGRW